MLWLEMFSARGDIEDAVLAPTREAARGCMSSPLEWSDIWRLTDINSGRGSALSSRMMFLDSISDMLNGD